MKIKFHFTSIAALAFCLWLPSNAAVQASANGDRMGRYDFSYAVQAHARVRPVQVFDDGKNTYFQFLGGDAIPAIFKMTEQGPELTIQSFEGPYLKVDGTAGQYLLRLGSISGRVVYSAGGREIGSAIPAAAAQPAYVAPVQIEVPAARPSYPLLAALGNVAMSPSDFRPKALDTNSYATPTKGDVTQWRTVRNETEDSEVHFTKGSATLTKPILKALDSIANGLTGDFSVSVVGRDDETLKETLAEDRARAIVRYLVSRGVPRDRIESRVGPELKTPKGWASSIRVNRTITAPLNRPATVVAANAPVAQTAVAAAPAPLEAPPEGFTLIPADRTIGGSIQRWARATSYQLVWEFPKDMDPEIQSAMTLRATNMKDAMEEIARGMKAKGYEMNATIYKNRVIRITQAQ